MRSLSAMCGSCLLLITLTSCSQPARIPDRSLPTATSSSALSPSARATAQDSRTAESQDSKTLRLAECLRQRGWQVNVSGDGIGVDYPVEQAQRFQSDEYACRVAAGIGLAPPTVSMEEAAWLYDEFLRIVPCVEQQGVPVSPPPSKAAFVEQLTNQPIPKWHPYDAAPERAEELAHKCPITPWPGK